MNKKSSFIIQQADELFDFATEELSRPEEDVVGYVVCQNASESISKYLTAYLTDHGVKVDSSTSVREMLDLCRSIDPRFMGLNLNALSKSDLKDLYMDMSTVRHFFSMARQTRDLVHPN